MVFGIRKRPIVSPHTSNDEPAWNGWTSSLLIGMTSEVVAFSGI